MRTFSQTIGEVRNGRVEAKATTDLAAVVAAVLETGKAGEVTMTVKVKPGKEQGEVSLVAKVTSKKPEKDIPEATFFVNEHGDLVRDDPRQRSMPFVRDADDQRTVRGLVAAG